MHACRQHCGGGGFGGVRLIAHAQISQQLFGVGQGIHQVADRRALITADIAHARFEQRLGDGEDALAGKLLTLTEFEVFDFALEGSFSHAISLQNSCLRTLASIFCKVARKARRSSAAMPRNMRSCAAIICGQSRPKAARPAGVSRMRTTR